MKRISMKILACIIIALCSISTVSMCIPVNASMGIEPYSYYEQSFSFRGTCNVARQVSGTFMDVKVKATASNNNNETITLSIYITKRNVTKTYTFYSDGQYHTYKNIYLGLSGGSNVSFTFKGANPAITIYTYMDVTS